VECGKVRVEEVTGGGKYAGSTELDKGKGGGFAHKPTQ